jgi:hypothetical protein
MFKKISALPPMKRALFWLIFPALVLCLSACRTASLPPVNFSEPGWKIQQGQAVWKSKRNAPEIAGEILLATQGADRVVIQFTKTPFPFLIAQKTTDAWQIEIPAQKKTYSGHGTPPKRITWLILAEALRGNSPPEPWKFEKRGENWSLKNPKSGEIIEGFLNR